MAKVIKTLLNVGLVLFFIVLFSGEARAEVGAPKITKLTAQDFFSLIGTASSESEILIYLDGNLFGQTEAIFNCSGSVAAESACQPSWFFQADPTQKLADGAHTVMAVARDKTSLILSAPTNEIKFTFNAVAAPTLIAPDGKTPTADLKPLITGLTRDNSSARIFIDGVYDGETGILRDDSGTASFSYQPTLALSRGWHKVQASASSGNQISSESNVLNFAIELPMPAPTVFKSVVNMNTSASRPFIVGLAKNDSKIKIYIDNKYNGELTVKNHLSGTANFAYKPVVALSRGAHSVYTVAVDKRGKESIRSNAVTFSTKSSAIAQSAQAENRSAVAEIKESNQPAAVKSEPVVISESSGAVLKKIEAEPKAQIQKPTVAGEKIESAGFDLKEKEQAIRQELKDKEKAALAKAQSLIGAGAEEVKSDRGMINESKQNQGRLKLDLIIFILFLLGVVAWLLWVNRELIKERRAQIEAEEKAEADNSKLFRGRDNKLF